MTDDIRVDSGSPVDLLIVAGLTVDVIGGVEVSGGAARYATEAALDAGYRVALHVVGGPELVVRETVERLGQQADVTWQQSSTSIVFEHHGAHDQRRLRLRSRTDDLQIPEPEDLPSARAVLFAPVAGEVSADALRRASSPFRAAGLQGWLRAADADGWVSHPPPEDVASGLGDALRGLDLLVASSDDLDGAAGPAALARLRAWIGPGPELVVTAGADGAWLDDGHRPAQHVPAHAVTDRTTIGAGDAFAAILTAQRGSGLDLAAAARAASKGTAHYLSTRPTGLPVRPMDGAPDADTLVGTAWRAERFGPDLAHTAPTSVEFSLEFEADRLSGRSGCNRFMGTWSAAGGTLAIGPLASTMMYCDGLMELESAYLAALQGATEASRNGDRLVLAGPDGEPAIEFRAAMTEDRPAD